MRSFEDWADSVIGELDTAARTGGWTKIESRTAQTGSKYLLYETSKYLIKIRVSDHYSNFTRSSRVNARKTDWSISIVHPDRAGAFCQRDMQEAIRRLRDPSLMDLTRARLNAAADKETSEALEVEIATQVATLVSRHVPEHRRGDIPHGTKMIELLAEMQLPAELVKCAVKNYDDRSENPIIDDIARAIMKPPLWDEDGDTDAEITESIPSIRRFIDEPDFPSCVVGQVVQIGPAHGEVLRIDGSRGKEGLVLADEDTRSERRYVISALRKAFE